MIVVDNISAPRKVNYEGFVQKALNEPYSEDDWRVVSVMRMASEACWGFQVVDLLTGAVHFAHRLAEGEGNLNPASLRGQLVDHVRGAFNVSKLNTATTPRFHVLEMFK